jgi:hypothetical protein
MTQTQASIQKVEGMERRAMTAIEKASAAVNEMMLDACDMQKCVRNIKCFYGLLVERDGKLFFAEEIK